MVIDGNSIMNIICFIMYCIACGIIAKHINEKKGYSNGFAWGAWLGIIGIIIVACKPKCVEEQTSKESLDMLEQLSTLHDKGVITDAEYEAKKKKLIDQI